MGQRAFYSINDAVLSQFNRLVPPSKRSKVIEEMMSCHVAAIDKTIQRAAELIENDPSYRDVEGDAAALAFENLARLETAEP